MTFIFLALLYIITLIAVILVEFNRATRKCVDPGNIFMFYVSLQFLLAPSALLLIFGFSEFEGANIQAWRERIYVSLDWVVAYLVFGLTICFFISYYLSFIGVSGVFRRLRANPSYKMSRGKSLVLLFVFVSLFAAFFWIEGGLYEGFAKMALIRAVPGYSDKTSEIFSQKLFGFVLPIALLCALIASGYVARGQKLIATIVFAFALFLSFLTIGRRGPVLVILIPTLAMLLWRNQMLAPRVWILLGIIGVVAVTFGHGFYRELLGRQGGSEPSVEIVEASLKFFGAVGRSVVESWGTIMFVDLAPRLGVDHMLSVIRRIPDRSLGLAINFPEPILDKVTRVLRGGEGYADTPPGAMGQMWLDFFVLGPVVWGAAFGSIVAVINIIWEKSSREFDECVVASFAIYLTAMPLSSGSLDFVLSAQYLLAVIGVILLKRRRTRWVF